MDGRSAHGKRRRRLDTFSPADFGGIEEDDDDLNSGVDVGFKTQHGMDDGADEDVQEGMSRSKPVVVVDSGFSTKEQSPEMEDSIFAPPSTVGSALKRNADGSVAAPRISNRKPKANRVRLLITILQCLSE